jgi:polysaccharide export outer membrane protein
MRAFSVFLYIFFAVCGLIAVKEAKTAEFDMSERAKNVRANRLSEFYLREGKELMRSGEFERALEKFKLSVFFDSENLLAKQYIRECKKRSPDFDDVRESAFEEIAPRPTDYRIGTDDILEIDVWQHPDLSTEVIVRPDGKISYLLIGDVQAAGLTVEQLDKVITDKLTIFAKMSKKKERFEAAPEPVEGEYRMQVGDKLEIDVWKSEDLSIETIVRPDGKISYPLIGDITAQGMTLTELDNVLTQRLSAYVKEPQVLITTTEFGKKKKDVTYVTDFISAELEEEPEVSVLVKRFGSRKVIVLGEVNVPGIYDITGSAKILDGIGHASDFTDYAVRENVFLIRGDVRKNPTVKKIDVWDILKRGEFEQNLLLRDQDIIYVPRNIIGNIKAFMDGISPTITAITDAVTLREAIKATWSK